VALPTCTTITGYKYHCKKCGYIGAFVIEKDIEEEAEK
jgi:hypothetical protein